MISKGSRDIEDSKCVTENFTIEIGYFKYFTILLVLHFLLMQPW